MRRALEAVDRGRPTVGLAGMLVAVILVVEACGGQQPTVSGGSTSRSISRAGVTLVLPEHWFASTAIRPQGGSTAFAWLQATNFTTRRPPGGEDPRKTMGPNNVVLTISEGSPLLARGRPAGAGGPLRLMASDVLPAFRTPRGHEVLERGAVIGRRAFTVAADFGSPAGARRSLPTVNGMLGSLRVHQTPPATPSAGPS